MAHGSSRTLWIAGAALAAVPVAALAADTLASKGAFTAAQAARGQALYTQNCASCHGEDMNGADVVPPLHGSNFQSNWTNQTAAALQTRIRTTMPLDNPGSLGMAQATDITAFVLSRNGYPAGQAELPPQTSAQAQVKLDAPTGN